MLGGEVILPLFTDGVTPLDYLLLQNTPAARQMLISYVGVFYSISNTQHDNWQNELRLKGYPSVRKIAISNGNHCAIPQNAPAGANLLSIDGNYSTGWLTDIVLTLFPSVNGAILSSLATLTNSPGFLMGILPGGNKITLDFKINSLPSSGTNQLYKGKITYTKKLLFLVNINVTITDKSINSPSNTLPYDYYPGGVFDTGLRNSNSGNSGNFWQQLLFKYKMTIATEPTFCFVPAASALDIGLGNVALNNSDYLKKYNVNAPLVAPKISPFINFITSFQDAFILDFEDNITSSNEQHIFLHLRNANWLAREIDNDANNNQAFDCSFVCANSQIQGPGLICSSATFSLGDATTTTTWSLIPSNAGTITVNSNTSITITKASGFIGNAVLIANISSPQCGTAPVSKNLNFGRPTGTASVTGDSDLNPGIGDSALFYVNTNNVNNFSFINWVVYSGSNPNAPLYFNLTPHSNGTSVTVVANSDTPAGMYTMQARVSNACGFLAADRTFEVYESGPPEIFPREGNKLYTVFPNPSNDIVNIEIKDASLINGEHIKIHGELFDVLGKSKLKVDIQNNSASFSVNRIPPGIYVLKIYLDDYIESHQIIVK